MNEALTTVFMVALAVVAGLSLVVIGVMAVSLTMVIRKLLLLVAGMAERKHIHRLLQEAKEAEERTAAELKEADPKIRQPGPMRPPNVWKPAPDDIVPNGQPRN